MTDIFFIIGDYIKGKSVYPAVRRILNLLFNLSITSYVYTKAYGNYSWLNYNDYKGILDYFIKGHFFIPFSIFLVVYSLIQFVSILVFSGINNYYSVKLSRRILLYQLNKDEIEKGLRKITKVSKHITPTRLTKSVMISVYQELRSKITHEDFNILEKELNEPKLKLEANFILAFRMIFAISIYFISLPQFGWPLYILTIIVLLLGMYILLIAHGFLDIFPTLMRRFHYHAEEYVKNLETTEKE